MKNIFEIIGIDDYEFTARYIPAFIFEFLMFLSFHDKFPVSLQTLKEINSILPIPLLVVFLIVLSFPIKTVLRLVGEIMEVVIWRFGNPVILYIKCRSKQFKNITIEVPYCNEKSLVKAIKKEDCQHIIIEYLKMSTRSDKKLREKLKDYGFFRNAFAAFSMATCIEVFTHGTYVCQYLIFSLIFGGFTLISAYYSYPKQLLNSFIENQIISNSKNTDIER